MKTNDPGAVRDGLAEIANALDKSRRPANADVGGSGMIRGAAVSTPTHGGGAGLSSLPRTPSP